MFGYIRPLECELKVREQTLYRAYYCGLCKCIGKRYALPARLALSYDCAFLAILLAAMAGGEERCAFFRCGVKPQRGKQLIAPDSEALDYAADVNVLLGYHQQRDGWTDEKRLSALSAAALIKGAAKKAARIRPELAGRIAAGLSELMEIEKRREAVTDEAACCFGALMRDILLLYPGLPPENRESGGWMFYNLGRWIYLADAWEDRKKDQSRGGYNPFLLAKTSREDAAFLLYISLTESEKGYDLITFPAENGILENIMHLGLRAKTGLLLQEGDEA